MSRRELENEVIRFLNELAYTLRAKILYELSESENYRVTLKELNGRVSSSLQVLAFHLDSLEKLGLVRIMRGKEVIIELTDKGRNFINNVKTLYSN